MSTAAPLAGRSPQLVNFMLELLLLDAVESGDGQGGVTSAVVVATLK
jgi:hypothetical protein